MSDISKPLADLLQPALPRAGCGQEPRGLLHSMYRRAVIVCLISGQPRAQVDSSVFADLSSPVSRKTGLRRIGIRVDVWNQDLVGGPQVYVAATPYNKDHHLARVFIKPHAY